VALNRAIAIAQAEGPEWGLEEIRLITDCNRLPHIRSIPRRSASSDFAVGGRTPRASTSEQRSHWRATRWSAGSSIAASARANQAARSGHITNNFGKLISKPRTESEE
jgi:predicted RNA polymerase sigma factor